MAAANPNVVVVLVNGSTVVLGDVSRMRRRWSRRWLGGQAAGGAIVDVLTGRVNPSGRLAETIPHRLEDNSSYLNFPGDSQVVRYGEGLFIGYRGYDKAGQDVALPVRVRPVLHHLRAVRPDRRDVAARSPTATSRPRVTVTVTNTGAVAGAEVVQVYVRDVESTVARPVRELKGFAKVALGARRVAAGHHRARPAGLLVLVGPAPRLGRRGGSVHHRGRHELARPAAGADRHGRRALASRAPLTRDSTLHEWMSDPCGRQLLQEAVAAGQPAPSWTPSSSASSAPCR